VNGPQDRQDYDVAIVGGALSGAATAILLLIKRPGLRILILEKSATFTRRVGEATVEVSGYFLGRVLGLTQHLNEGHLMKQGMRFWFCSSKTETLPECSEIGGRYLARVPSYQVDRAVLDEEVLRRAQAMGAVIWRRASVSKIKLAPGGSQELAVRRDDKVETILARWVVDASGVASILARQEGWWRPNKAHPTTAVWARWTGVRDWDGLDLAAQFPEWAKICFGIRGTATNHFVGKGWWAWCIPLKGGDVSIGVVFDQRLVTWPEHGSLGQRLKDFLGEHPVAREIMKEAQWREGDVHWRRNLPYYATTFAGDGFALVGDAAGFLDPFYSPGMDWIGFTTWRTAELILAQQQGKDLKPLITAHNREFANSYARWFQALYQDKYEYMGEFDLMRLAFLLDLGFYYFGIASQPFKYGAAAFSEPPFSRPVSLPFFWLMRAYNRRLSQIAQSRRKREKLGSRNHGRRFLFPGYMFGRNIGYWVVRAMAGWGWLEIREGWRSWFSARSASSATAESEAPAAVPEATAL